MMRSMFVGGVKVVEHPLIGKSPRMKLSDKVTVTAAFRAEMDKWMLEFFGEQHDVLRVNGELLVGPEMYMYLVKVGLEKQQYWLPAVTK